MTNYDRWDHHHRDEAWLNVGKAQREVPAHIAHEYCRGDRSFDPRPEFYEETLPRCFTFDNYVPNVKYWFPLASSSSGLGFDFGLLRGRRAVGAAAWLRRGLGGGRGLASGGGAVDLAAVSHLDEVRTADLTQSREILEMASPNHGLRS